MWTLVAEDDVVYLVSNGGDKKRVKDIREGQYLMQIQVNIFFYLFARVAGPFKYCLKKVRWDQIIIFDQLNS